MSLSISSRGLHVNEGNMCLNFSLLLSENVIKAFPKDTMSQTNSKICSDCLRVTLKANLVKLNLKRNDSGMELSE